jgi:hypothetical protein
MFSLIETVKEDRLLDVKINRRECLNRVKQLLESDQTGFTEDSPDAEKRACDRAKKALDSSRDDWDRVNDILELCRKGVPTTNRA